MSNQVIYTDAAPQPAPVLSQGVRRGPWVQVSGQGPVDPATGDFVELGDVAGQTRAVLENIRTILEAGGASVGDLFMVRVYLTARDDFEEMNRAYGEFFAAYGVTDFPARTTVFTGLPHEPMLVEIDGLALID
ncbi:reactive intermediate/imine deaminase [Microbacterium sp. AG1240]|uniref:RidA family protein n=1 Tax=Microbacterium sp. AG1240 TaxID=2183992 RepID=UPI000EACAF1B|nr:RidA family protein [Microbacterium sp. AG1240]RKT31618.1 reactive intermediate/imine deaminase [Microbacterium sp. AG1240]